jgi:DNA-binding NtrC family response regulator
MAMKPMRPDLSILYVEDDAIIAMEMTEVLQAIGFDNVLVANNLGQANAFVKSHEFDFALLDLNLGHGERSADLGSSLAEAGAHVVFVSGYTKADLGSFFRDFDFLEKPTAREDVEVYFKTVFDQAAMRRIAAE